MLKKVTLTLTFLIASFCLTACLNPEQPKVNFIEYKVNSITTDGIELTFLFEVENPNSLDISVASYKYKLFVNDRELIDEIRPGFNIPKNSKQNIIIPLKFRYDKLFGASLGILEALAKGEKELDYRLEGDLNVKFVEIVFHVPMNSSGKIPIPKDITF